MWAVRRHLGVHNHEPPTELELAARVVYRCRSCGQIESVFVREQDLAPPEEKPSRRRRQFPGDRSCAAVAGQFSCRVINGRELLRVAVWTHPEARRPPNVPPVTGFPNAFSNGPTSSRRRDLAHCGSLSSNVLRSNPITSRHRHWGRSFPQTLVSPRWLTTACSRRSLAFGPTLCVCFSVEHGLCLCVPLAITSKPQFASPPD